MATTGRKSHRKKSRLGAEKVIAARSEAAAKGIAHNPSNFFQRAETPCLAHLGALTITLSSWATGSFEATTGDPWSAARRPSSCRLPPPTRTLTGLAWGAAGYRRHGGQLSVNPGHDGGGQDRHSVGTGPGRKITVVRRGRSPAAVERRH